MVVFTDRRDAGERLARELIPLAGLDVVVLGLPRGGLPVAERVAGALGAALDVIVVRKIGTPGRPELAIGAISEGGLRVLDEETVRHLGVSPAQLHAVEAAAHEELDALTRRLRHGRARVAVRGRTVVIVDDGMATGATARVACLAARRLGARRVVLAVPVAPAATVRALREADAVVCVTVPERFVSVASHYRSFDPVDEAEVVAALDRAGHRPGTGGPAAAAPAARRPAPR